MQSNSLKILASDAGKRIDVFLTQQFPIFSRSIIKKLLDNQQVIINSTSKAKPSYLVKENDIITLLSIPMPADKNFQNIPDDIGVTIIAEHPDFLIINKPVGLVVHPPQESYTEIALTGWLSKQYPSIVDVGDAARPGIVHRLDRNTSGIMIVALTNEAYRIFTQMFKDRKIEKTYQAVVQGHPPLKGSIDFYIGRHPVKKNIMHCFVSIPENSSARDALTNYTTLKTFETYSLVEIKPKTGRTHQIRVHFKAIGHPLLGDTTYGMASKKIAYHVLHAQQLEFVYKETKYLFQSPIPDDFKKLL